MISIYIGLRALIYMTFLVQLGNFIHKLKFPDLMFYQCIQYFPIYMTMVFFIKVRETLFSKHQQCAIVGMHLDLQWRIYGIFEGKRTSSLQGYNLSHPMGKPTICIGENKGTDQIRGNREADQRLCFRYTDSTISLLLKSEISSF